MPFLLKFIHSEKVTKFCEIFSLLLTVCTAVKSKEKISQNFVAFSEYENFTSNRHTYATPYTSCFMLLSKLKTLSCIKTSSHQQFVKFIYFEKATKFCEIFSLLLTVCTEVKNKGKISLNFVAFSEYMNFREILEPFFILFAKCSFF